MSRNKLCNRDEAENESSAKQVGWQSYDSQTLNFEVATQLDNLSWNAVDSVLDVGCGYGELIPYLRTVQGFTGTYTGIDILERFIDKATQTHGQDHRNTLICGDILSCDQLQSAYDVVIAMGTLSVNCDYPAAQGEKTECFTNQLIEFMCSLARLAVVVYFIDIEKTTFMERAIAGNMALYDAEDIRNSLIQGSSKRYRQLTMESYPKPASAKTIAKIYYDAPA